MSLRLALSDAPVTLAALREVARRPTTIEISRDVMERVTQAHSLVGRILREDAPVYGLNTGFGLLANTRIAPERLADLQRNLVLSHATGIGPLLDDAVVRLVLVLKLVSLARGHSGVRPALLEHLRAEDAEGVALELEKQLRVLHFMWRLATCGTQRSSA